MNNVPVVTQKQPTQPQGRPIVGAQANIISNPIQATNSQSQLQFNHQSQIYMQPQPQPRYINPQQTYYQQPLPPPQQQTHLMHNANMPQQIINAPPQQHQQQAYMPHAQTGYFQPVMQNPIFYNKN